MGTLRHSEGWCWDITRLQLNRLPRPNQTDLKRRAVHYTVVHLLKNWILLQLSVDFVFKSEAFLDPRPSDQVIQKKTFIMCRGCCVFVCWKQTITAILAGRSTLKHGQRKIRYIYGNPSPKFSSKVQLAVVERYFTPLWEVTLFSARNLLVKVFNPCMTLCGGWDSAQ